MLRKTCYYSLLKLNGLITRPQHFKFKCCVTVVRKKGKLLKEATTITFHQNDPSFKMSRVRSGKVLAKRVLSLFTNSIFRAMLSKYLSWTQDTKE